MVRRVLNCLLRHFLFLLLVLSFSAQALALTPSIPVLAPGSDRFLLSTSENSKQSALPLEKVRITSKFGPRKHPVLKKASFHGGVDMGAQLNDEVKSIADGVVTFAGPKGALGNAVFISHGKLKATSIYGHLNKVSIGKGTMVKTGAVIGYAGTTGRSTGVHLHLTVKDHRTGKSVEPLSFIASIDKKGRARSSPVVWRQAFFPVATV